MAIDQNALETQKQLQRAGYNYVPLNGDMNDPLTRKALAQMNQSHGWGGGIGASALTKEGISFLGNNFASPKTTPTPTSPIARQEIQSMGQVGMVQPNYNDYINQYKNAQRQSTIAGLDSARNNALSNLNRQRATVQPKYYDARNQASVGSQLSAKNFAEYMANRGQTNSGTSAQAEITRNMQLQGDVGNLKRQEMQELGDLSSRETDIRNAYETDVARANADIETNALNNLMNQYNTDRNYGLSVAGMTGMLNGQRTLSGQQFDQGLKQQGWENNFNQSQFEYQKQLDTINRERADRQQAIENAYRNGQFSLEQRNAALNQEEFNYRKQQDALDRQTPKTTTTSYKTDPDYKTDYTYAITNGIGAVEQLTARAEEFIQKYGVDGYNALLKAARGE